MLYAVTGRPGEGKSCFAVQHLILKELESGSRPIYTNIWLHRGKINHYLKRQGIKVDLKRLHYLEEHQIRRFWTYAEKDALLVLDEVGEFFNANAWKELSADPQWDPASYARLHRKVGHETYLIVQDLNHIYKQYRDLISFHIQLVNSYYRKILGFSGPKLFIAKTFDQLTPHKSISSRVYKYDKKIFELYNTEQVYEVNSGVETSAAQKYKETEIRPDKYATIRRNTKAVFGWFSQRAWGFLIIAIIIVAVFVLKNAPGFVAGMMKSTKELTTGEEEEIEIIEEEINDEVIKEEVVETESVGVVNAVKSATGFGTRRGGGAHVSLIRYDSVIKRKP